MITDLLINQISKELGQSPSEIETGSIQRFGKEKTCWYIAYQIQTLKGEVYTAVYGDWKTGISSKFSTFDERKFSLEERTKIKEAQEEATREAQRKADEDREHRIGIARHIWDSSSFDGSSLYLDRKGLDLFVFQNRVKYGRDNHGVFTVFPYEGIDENGDLRVFAVQKIYETGEKKYYGAKKGASFSFCEIDESTSYLVVCEGIATGATVYTQLNKAFLDERKNIIERLKKEIPDNEREILTNKRRALPPYPVVCAGDCHSLKHTIEDYKYRFNRLKFIIAADNDRFGRTNVGIEAAKALATSKDVLYIYPKFNHSEKGTDWNDLLIDEGQEALDEQLSPEIIEKFLDRKALKYLSVTELERKIAQKNRAGTPCVEEVTEIMNREYAVIQNVGGKASVIKEDPKTKEISVLGIKDQKEFFLNRKAIKEISEKTGKPVFKSYYDIWLENPFRKTYRGLDFDPSCKAGKDVYNLFRGWTVQPKRNDEKIILYQNHIHDIVCGGDLDTYTYVWNWLCHLFQKPEELPLKALVMCDTKQGAGKNTFVEPIAKLLGDYAKEEVNMDRLTRNFNAHFANCLLLHANEAFWGGVQSKSGILKAMITEPFQMIERKGKEPFQLANYKRIIVSSNDLFSVPVDPSDRRLLILEVSDSRVGDLKYFTELKDSMKDSEFLPALLWALQNEDISTFDLRQTPESAIANRTAIEIKLETIAHTDNVTAWWQEILEDGVNHPLTENSSPYDDSWYEEVSTEDLYNQYLLWCESRRKAPAVKRGFCRKLAKYLPEHSICVKRVGKKVERYFIGLELPICRALFEKHLKAKNLFGEENDE